MARKKKTMVTGAVISVLSKLIHPSQAIRDKYTNPADRHRLSGGIVIRQEVRNINRPDQQTIVFRHNDFDDVELYAIKRFCLVETEGNKDHFFKDNVPGEDLKPLEVINLHETTETVPDDITDLIARAVGDSNF